jgi:predicted PurR-regulated permease PerM
VNSYSSVLNTLLIAVVIVACVFFAREVFIPITLAGILSFMLAPVVRMLQRLRFHVGLPSLLLHCWLSQRSLRLARLWLAM